MAAYLKYGLCAVIAFSSILPSFAQAQSRDLINRLNRLENEVQTLNEALFRGNVKPKQQGAINHSSPSQSAQVEVRLSALERELRGLTGTIEEIDFRSRQVEAKVEKYLADANLRFQDIENKIAAGSIPQQQIRSSSALNRVEVTNPEPVAISRATSEPQNVTQVTEPPAQVISSSNATVAYEQAFALLRQGQYEAAEAAFKQFLDQYPEDNLVSNAQYWLSETYYVRGLYQEAARGFATGYKQYPQASKKADNLLKLGLSLSAIGKTEDACVTLKQLAAEVPDAPAPIQRRAEQEEDKLGC